MAKIALTGKPCAGKTSFARALSRLIALCVVDVGDVLRQALLRHGVAPATRAEIGPVFLRHYSPEAIAHLLLNVPQSHTVIVFDAVRLLPTCRILQDAGVLIWYVDSDEGERRKRLDRRLRSAGLTDEALARARLDYASYDSEQTAVRHAAVGIINNTGTLDALDQEAAKYLKHVPGLPPRRLSDCG